MSTVKCSIGEIRISTMPPEQNGARVICYTLFNCGFKPAAQQALKTLAATVGDISDLRFVDPSCFEVVFDAPIDDGRVKKSAGTFKALFFDELQQLSPTRKREWITA